jgi:hypothetical protein
LAWAAAIAGRTSGNLGSHQFSMVVALKWRGNLFFEGVRMLKSYEATLENGQIHWLGERPEASVARIIVTVLADEILPGIKRRTAPTSIAGKGRTLGDIVSPIVDEQDWDCLQ